METDIGNPIEYNPTMDPLITENDEAHTQEEQPYYMDYPMQPQHPPPQTEKIRPFR